MTVVFNATGKVIYLLVGSLVTLQIIGQHRSKAITPMLGLLMYIAYMYLVSQWGWMPLISTLKLSLFLIFFFAFYSVATASATRASARPEVLRSIFLGFACFFIFGSLAVMPFPEISLLRVQEFFLKYGYIPEGSLFMGISNHSQALGPITAIFATFLLADWLFAVKRWSWLYAILLACTPILVYKTGSRTAMGTYAAGLLFVSFFFMQARGVGAKWKSRALTVGFFVGLFGIFTLFATPSMRQSVANFVFKSRGAEVLKEHQTFEKLLSTRQGLVDEMKETIAESPVIGNGFQVSEEMKFLRVQEFSQLLSAPIEKGVWIYAVVEEGGAFGMGIFCLFLLMAFGCLLSRRAYIGASIFFVFTVSNLGEFTFFSVSGMGGIFWAMLFAGLALDAQRLRQQRQPLANYDLRMTNDELGGANPITNYDLRIMNGNGYHPLGGSYTPKAGNYR